MEGSVSGIWGDRHLGKAWDSLPGRQKRQGPGMQGEGGPPNIKRSGPKSSRLDGERREEAVLAASGRGGKAS